ncbi:MAG: hypothetical protein FJX72_06875 [Armatimonadetes bacterium]|nr:hypothetical protein [Armatimonadota bacterium]
MGSERPLTEQNTTGGQCGCFNVGLPALAALSGAVVGAALGGQSGALWAVAGAVTGFVAGLVAWLALIGAIALIVTVTYRTDRRRRSGRRR